MNFIHHFSSRCQRLDHAFLSARLIEAQSYKRIAGYFCTSIFELVAEEIAAWSKSGRPRGGSPVILIAAIGFWKISGAWRCFTAMRSFGN
jgi:hypothetical protein